MSNVFEIRDRLAAVFKFNGTVPPEPKCGEGPEPYRARALSYAQNLLPRGHAWSSMPLRHVPLDVAERFLVADRVAEFKRPVGKLRVVTEQCPRTGRVTTKFYGDPEHTWGPFKGVAQRITGFTSAGRGADSPHAKEQAAAAAQENALAHQALAEKRAGVGIVVG
jgi:hypothetical protein